MLRLGCLLWLVTAVVDVGHGELAQCNLSMFMNFERTWAACVGPCIF